MDLRTTRALGFILTSLSLAVVTPLLTTTYLGDDIFNSSINGVMRYEHVSIWQAIGQPSVSWFKEDGRLLFVSYAEIFGLFHLLTNLIAYKVLVVGLILLNLATFIYLLKCLGANWSAAFVVILIVLASLQMQTYADPLLGFSAGLPLMLEIDLISFVLFALYCNGGGKSLLAVSLVIFVLAAVWYETNYTLSVIHYLIAWSLSRKNALARAWPFLAVSVLMFGLALFLRHQVHVAPRATYALNLAPGAYLRALLEQLSAAIPLSHLMFQYSVLYGESSPISIIFGGVWWLSASIFLLCTVAGAICLHRMTPLWVPRATWSLALIGSALWILPAILLVAVPRYQHEIAFGRGYIFVYMEYFGFSLLAGTVLCGLIQVMRQRLDRYAVRALNFGVAVAIALTLTVTYGANARVMTIFGGERNYRSNLTAALNAGLFSDVGMQDILYEDATFAAIARFGGFTDPKYFYAANGAVIGAVRPVSPTNNACMFKNCSGEGGAKYVSYDVAFTPRAGYVILARLSNNNGMAQGGNDLSVFTRGPGLGHMETLRDYTISYKGWPCGNSGGRGPSGLQTKTGHLDRLRISARGSDWLILHLGMPCEKIVVDSIVLGGGPS